MNTSDIKQVFESCTGTNPKVSVVLLDWSVRESYHVLDYLNKQRINRAQYEIIWIEYYSRRSPEIEEGLKESGKFCKLPVVDKWIVMGMPDNVYYHKHLMFNVGIVASQGKIITFCDSDAMVSPTFVESIINSFEEENHIVLHMDEVRNIDKRFYPFNYPSIEEIKGKGCINWKDGKTTGLLDREDPLHTRNYGACMSALREDFMNIGGADEHVDYLGHICGPYEMTFRLVNSGKKEVWHQEEFIFHTWHPGVGGKSNYWGPHDGRNMSTTALKARITGRVMPLVENPAIRILRLNKNEFFDESLISLAIHGRGIEEWVVEKVKQKGRSLWKLNNFIEQPLDTLQFLSTLFKLLIRQFSERAVGVLRESRSMKEILRRAFLTFNYLKNMNQYNIYTFERCKGCLEELAANNINEIVLYGTGNASKILYKLTRNSSIKIKEVYDNYGCKRFYDYDVKHVESIKDYCGKVVIIDMTKIEDKVELFKKMGVRGEQIIVI